MLKESYSIPKGIHARFDFQQYSVDTAIANAISWGIAATVLTNIAPVRTEYELRYKVVANKQTRSVAATAARDAAWEKYDIQLRELYDNSFINNAAINSDEKSGLGIHITNTKQKMAHRVPVSSPVVILASEEISVLHVVYSDSNNTDTHAKPYGVAFLEMVVKIAASTAPPVSAAECSERYNISRNHEAITFEDTDRGKTVFAFSRWITTTGDRGPWSGMVSGIIP